MAILEKPQDNQPAFVLHTYAYRETSLIVEALTQHAGRVALLAKGARRPRSAVRGLLMAFQPLTLSWFGKRELRTLKNAEWQGGQRPLAGSALMCGFYLNELLLKLLPRDDPHPQLFLYYQQTLKELGEGEPQVVEGMCTGRIITECRGIEGFGYDPLFIPDGYDRTFAEMDAGIKNGISHRAHSLKAAADAWTSVLTRLHSGQG